MTRLFSKKAALAALTLGMALMGSAGSAKAALAIYLAEDAGAYTLANSSAGNFVAFGGAFGDFLITVETGLTNFTGTNTLGSLATTTSTVLGVGGGTHTLHVLVAVVSGTASGDPLASFLLPAGPDLALQSQLSTTSPPPTFTAGSQVAFTSFANATGDPTAPAGGTPSPTVTLTSTPSSIAAADTTFIGTTGVYTLYNLTDITLVGAFSSVASTGTSDVVNAVPEPSSIIAVVAGLPVLTLALRRRKASK